MTVGTKTRTKKAIVGISFFFLLLVVGFFTLLLNPQSLFAHQSSYKNYHIYSGEEPNLKPLEGILDQAEERLKTSELYDESYKYDIFFSHNHFYNRLDNLVFGSWAAARAIDNNLIVKIETDFDQGVAYTEDDQLDLVYLFTHEMMHCLQANAYGKRKFNPFFPPPLWKLEGYPEYVARTNFKELNLRMAIALILDMKVEMPFEVVKVENEPTPYFYYKSYLMTRYLIEIKSKTYDDILRDERTEEEVWEEVVDWAVQTH
ncbi:MAG: collagenase [Bacteroidota bacterium]